MNKGYLPSRSKIAKVFASGIVGVVLMGMIEYYGEKAWSPELLVERASPNRFPPKQLNDTLWIEGAVVTGLLCTHFQVQINAAISGDHVMRKYLLNKGIYSIYKDTVIWCCNSPNSALNCAAFTSGRN